ncbi:MAG: flagellar hook assembly protein FlgD [Rhodoblastus sp.]|nr:MAG: flagellar hook assembly protein FlgD [Rhodoblastus sp.]
MVDYNSFLKLLVAQAQNQDPTNPQDSTQYLSQLASFSAVEQQTQTNAKLDALLSASRLTQADGLIGRHIASADGTASGVVASVTFSSSGLFATLTNGANVPIVDGVVLS